MSFAESDFERGEVLGDRRVTACSAGVLEMRGLVWKGALYLTAGIASLVVAGFIGWMVLSHLLGMGQQGRFRRLGRAIAALCFLIPFGLSAVVLGPSSWLSERIDGGARTITRRRFFGLYRKTWSADEIASVRLQVLPPREDGSQRCLINLCSADGVSLLRFCRTPVEMTQESINVVDAAEMIAELLGAPLELVGQFADDASYEFRDLVEQAIHARGRTPDANSA